MNDDYILTYFYGKNHKRLNKQLLNNIPNDIYEYLIHRYSDSSCILETLERIKKHIDIHPICESCGKPVKYVGSTRMFLNSCGDIYCQQRVNILHGKRTNLIKYGVNNPAKSNLIKQKIKETNIKKYGYSSPLLNKYIKEKTDKTNIEKYGFIKPQLNETIKSKIGLKNKLVQQTFSKEKIAIKNEKRYAAYLKHDSWKVSNKEKESYNILINKFIDIKTQYKTVEYPFNCDFFIPKLNLYIECNYHWTHGPKPFNINDNECIKLLEIWNNRSKTSNYFKQAIKTWTKRDVNKRNIAKQNNLNWIEFFNITELKEWVSRN